MQLQFLSGESGTETDFSTHVLLRSMVESFVKKGNEIT